MGDCGHSAAVTARRRLRPILHATGATGAAATTRTFRHSYQDRIVKAEMPTPARSALLGHTARINESRYGDPIGYELRELVQPSWELTQTKRKDEI